MDNMKSINISNTEADAVRALEAADEYISGLGLENKRGLHLRLIAEETIGMVRAMAGDFNATFSIECEADKFRVRLVAKTEMDKLKKDNLLSVSTSGKNAAARGFMGRVADIMENFVLDCNDSMRLNQEWGAGYADHSVLGFYSGGDLPAAAPNMVWSLSSYREQLETAPVEVEQQKDAWDELEKSIVANIAGDVIVGVKKGNVEMIITEK